MPNDLGELSQEEELLLHIDGRHNPAEPFNDNPDVTWETYLNPYFHHLGDNCYGNKVLVLSAQGRERVEKILLHPSIRRSIMARLCANFHNVSTITAHMNWPYCEKHIQPILDSMVQDGSVQIIPAIQSGILPLYTV